MDFCFWLLRVSAWKLRVVGHKKYLRSNALVERLRGGDHRRVGGIVDNLDLFTLVNNWKKLDRQ